MAIVNVNFQFMMVDFGANGRVSNGRVMKNTIFLGKMSKNQPKMPDSHELLSDNKKKFLCVHL